MNVVLIPVGIAPARALDATAIVGLDDDSAVSEPEAGAIVMTVYPFLIGRKGDCDHIINEKKVSKLHCVFAFNGDGKPVVRDLASTNGTKVNGVRIKHHVLKAGDLVQISDIGFRVELR